VSTDRQPDLHAAARTALACLDLTSLNDSDTAADIDALCRRAQTAHGPVAAVHTLPVRVADDGGRRAAGSGVVFGGEEAAEGGLDAQHGEVIAGDEEAVDVPGGAAEAGAQA